MAANLQPISSDGGFTSGGNININNGSDIVTAINEDLNIIVQDEEDDGWALKQTITDGIGNNLSQTTLDSSSFLIELGSDQWQFDGNTLQVTTDSTIRGFNTDVVVQSMVSGGNPVASLQVVNSVNDPNIFSTFDATASGANIKVYNGGSNGGTEYAWQFDNDGNLTVPGDTTVSTAESTGGAAGNSISIIAGAADQSDYYTTAGGNVNITGGLGATDDGGGGGPGGSVNISAGVSSDPVGNAGNVVVTVGGSIYTFTELDLNVTTDPPASPAPSLNGFGLVSAPIFTNGTGNVTIQANLNPWVFDNTGNLTIPGSSGGFIKTVANASIGIAAVDKGTNNPAQLLSMTDAGAATSIISAYATNATIQTNATGTMHTWAFDNAGTLTAPGNITGNYFIGNGSQLTGISGNIANITANVISFNTAAGINVAAGQMAWNSSDGTLDIGLSYANVVLQVGQETHYVVRNDTGNIIENGTAVYCSGVTAGSGRIEASPMMGNISPVKFLGLATQDINNGVNGVVTHFGYVRGLDTRGTANTAISVGDETWAVGDQLYVHPTAAGKLTNVEPAAPNVKICVASIMTRNQTSGVVFVRPTSNLDMTDLSDVQITSPASDQILLYDNNRWENVNFGIDIDTTPTLGGNLAGAGFNVSNVSTISATGNITGGNIIGNGSGLSNVAVKTAGSWTLASGVNTVSISVPLNGTYTIWINGNIPNGIVTYTATAIVTNTNVPVLGSQYAWYYEIGNALVFTSIPDQFVGTAGSISNASPYSGNTANVFTFGITNNSGASQVVNYGYTKL